MNQSLRHSNQILVYILLFAGVPNPAAQTAAQPTQEWFMRFSKFLSASLLFAAGAASAAPMYYAGTGHYYDFIASTGTRANAAAGAAALSFSGATGYLASVTSAGENAFLLSLLPAAEIGWLGGSFDGTNWNWDNGDGTFWLGSAPGGPNGSAYANWDTSTGEPNGGTGEPYLLMRPSGKWQDYTTTGADVGGYFVEFNAVPEPGTLALVGLAALGAFGARRRHH